MFDIYQKYLKLYEEVLSDFIESLNVSIEDFYMELSDIVNDPNCKDKKLLNFANYLVASADYKEVYKVMWR